MNGFFGRLSCIQCGTSVIVNRTATMNDRNSSISITLQMDNDEAERLESQLREIRLARTPSVVAECINLASATGPVQPVDLEEVSARR